MAVTILEGKFPSKDLDAGVIFKALHYAWDDDVDVFFGKQPDLIAAGLARLDQFVRSGSTWLSGERITKRCRRDETYRRITFRRDLDLWRVDVGLSSLEVPTRKTAAKLARETVYEQRAREVAQNSLAVAQRELRAIPRSERGFRLELLNAIRCATAFHVDRAAAPSQYHGFTIDAESAHAIKVALDAVAEAVVRVTVQCDHVKHARIVSARQADVVASGGGAPRSVEACTRLNPLLLLGEVTS